MVALLGTAPTLIGRALRAADRAPAGTGGVLRVGTTGDYAPFSVAKGRAPVGFDVDLTERLARDLGLRVEYVTFAWANLIADLEAGRFDVAASGVTVRAERAVAGRYARPYAFVEATVAIRRRDGQRLRDRAALDREGIRIVVNRGGHLERVAHRLFPRATIDAVSDNTTLADRVSTGSADAAMTETVELRAWQRPELIGIGPFTHDRKALLIRQDAPDLARSIDAWLEGRERDGWLAGLRKQRLGEDMLPGAAPYREAVVSDLQQRCGLMPLVAAAKAARGMAIEDRAQEERVLARAQATGAACALHAGSVARLFEALIAAAKAIQAATKPDGAASPTLEQLRAPIAATDEHLLRQLAAALPVVRPDEWLRAVPQDLEVDGLTPEHKHRIAAALAEWQTLRVRPAALP